MKNFVEESDLSQQAEFLAEWKENLSELSKENREPKSVYITARRLGLSLLRAGHQADAALYFRRILNACDSASSTSNELEIDFRLENYVCLGASLEEIGLKNTALATYKEGLALTSKTDNKEYMAMLLNNIGVIYYSIDDLDAALEFFERALQTNLSLKEKNLNEIYLNYMNISEIYDKEGDTQKAIDLALKALQYINSADSETHYTHAVTLAILYKKLGNTPLASSYIDNAIEKLDSLTNMPMLITAMQVKSDILTESGNVAESLLLNSKAIEMAQRIGNQRTHLILLKQRANIEKQQGNLQQAYSLLEKSEALKDSLSKADSGIQQQQLQILLKSETQQPAFLSFRNPLVIVIFAILIMAIAALSIALFWKKKKKKSDMQEALSQDNMQSESFMKDTLRKTSMVLLERARANEQLTSISHELKDYLHTVNIKNPTDKSKLGQVVKKIDQISHRTDWKELQFYLENSDAEFVAALEQRFPDLTTKDKRLCILIRLMLSNKEISALTSLEVKSVETARTRLRKKMGLDREVNMTDFLRSIG